MDGIGDTTNAHLRAEIRTQPEDWRRNAAQALSEGTLLLTVGPARARVLAALHQGGIDAAEIGEVLPDPTEPSVVVDGRAEPLTHPGADPFWAAYAAWGAASEPPAQP